MSSNKYDKNLTDYISKALSESSIKILYNQNNIIVEKCELFSDFVRSLHILIFETYLGDEFTDFDDKLKHFRWCWNKNSENFKKEGIVFVGDDVYNYFLEFTLEVFYTAIDKSKFNNSGKLIMDLWSSIFKYDTLKTASDIDTLIEIYRKMDKTLKFIV